MNMSTGTSRIRMQIMWDRLQAVVEEQAQTLMRTAFNPIVRECGDLSAGIFDREARMLAQAVTGTPGHVNTMAESVRHFRHRFPVETMCEGDIYLTNDPWIGAGHLNDFVVVRPIFRNGSHVGFVACVTHLTDVGGIGFGPDGSDIYDEGIRIPLCRLVDGGQLDEFVLEVIKVNNRMPTEAEGDIYAQIACLEVGASRVVEMMQEFDLADLEVLGSHIVDTSRDGTIALIRELPRGTFRHEVKMDGYDFEILLKSVTTITKDAIEVDFSGSSALSRHGINVPLAYAQAYTVFALKCVVAPHIPNNAGALAPFRVSAPVGCIVNAPHPAPVAMRHVVGQMLPDLVFGCLHQAMAGRVPAEGASCLWDLPIRGGFTADRGINARRFAIELVHSGGMGARPTKDGLSATAYPSGIMGSQVEMTESVTPLLIRRRELRPDSGGPGATRGGTGQIIEIESGEGAPIQLFATLDRIRNPAQGRDGGAAGMPGHIALASGRTISPKGMQEIAGADRLIVETPGGGGYGHPYKRDPASVVVDVLDGLVSLAAAERDYGVVIGASGELDQDATRRRRASA